MRNTKMRIIVDVIFACKFEFVKPVSIKTGNYRGISVIVQFCNNCGVA